MKYTTSRLLQLTCSILIFANTAQAEFNFVLESRKANAQAARAYQVQTEEERINQLIDESGPVNRRQLREIMDERPDFYYGQNRKVVILDENPQPEIVKFVKTEKQNWGPYTVFGYTEEQILEMVNDERGSTCSEDHNQGDMANRYCHANIVKGVDRSLQYLGVNKTLAALMGAAVFIPKEYLYDKNPSMSDLVIADYAFVNNEKTRVEVTAFADGAIFFVIKRRF